MPRPCPFACGRRESHARNIVCRCSTGPIHDTETFMVHSGLDGPDTPPQPSSPGLVLTQVATTSGLCAHSTAHAQLCKTFHTLMDDAACHTFVHRRSTDVRRVPIGSAAAGVLPIRFTTSRVSGTWNAGPRKCASGFPETSAPSKLSQESRWSRHTGRSCLARLSWRCPQGRAARCAQDRAVFHPCEHIGCVRGTGPP